MMRRLSILSFLLTLLMVGGVLAQDAPRLRLQPAQNVQLGLQAQAQEEPQEAQDAEDVDGPMIDGPVEEAPEPAEPAVEQDPPGTMQFFLMDGSILTGTLAIDSLPINTEFGRLTVPIESIQSFAPGLQSHPALAERLDTLIEQLGSANADQRDQAQAQLLSYGPGVMIELQRYAEDSDAERKVRVAAIMESLYEQQMEDASYGENSPGAGSGPSLVRLDEIVTPQFTIAGSIAIDRFEIRSKFGTLTVTLGDIKSAGIVNTEVPEIRRNVQINGTDAAPSRYKTTGIRVNRGDRIIIRAQGQITMSPWGSNVQSTPDGAAQSGSYKGNIPMGSLVGRIGDSGEEMLIGSDKTFTAQRAGTLYLGFAIDPRYANHQFPGSYEARIRVIPAE